MTRHIRDPISRAEHAKKYAISAEMFFCLIKIYRDFSKKQAGFELIKYYELYLQVLKNKRILSILLTPKSNLTAYLESYSFDYDIVNQQQILDSKHELWDLALADNFEHDHGNFQDLVVPAVMLKKIYQAYQIFIHENNTGLPLLWHHYHVAFLADEWLMALEIYPATDVESWMKGDLGGLQGYVMFDLGKDQLLDYMISTFPKSAGYLHREHRKRQSRLNQKLKKQHKLS